MKKVLGILIAVVLLIQCLTYTIGPTDFGKVRDDKLRASSMSTLGLFPIMFCDSFTKNLKKK